MSRVNSDAARLRRLRRLAARRGLAVLAAIKPNPSLPNGGYMLSDDASRQVILGDRPAIYSASLDEIENYLDGQSQGEGADET